MSRIIAPQWVNRRKRGNGLPRLQANRLRRQDYVAITSVAGLEALYDSREVNVSQGSGVETWTDLSGNERDLSQPTAAEQPTFEQAALNSLPCLEFDGSDDIIKSTDLGAVWSGDPHQPFTLACVMQFVSIDGDVFHMGNSTSETQFMALRDNGFGSWRTRVVSDSGSVVGVTPDIGTGHHVVVLRNSESDGISLRIDGTQEVSAGSYDIGQCTWDQFAIGGRWDTDEDRYANVRVGIWAMYSSWVDGTDLTDLESYLGDEYDITVA